MREEAQARRHAQVAELKKQDYLDLDKLTLLDPAQSQNSNVLQPIPAQQINYKLSSHDTMMLTKNINISDFESDTSSPFDNMELKTINDLEELATVLKPTSISTTSPILTSNNTNSHNSQLSNISVSQYYPTTIYNKYPENYRSYEFVDNTNIQINQPISSIPVLKSSICEDSKATLPPVTMPNVLLQLKADLNTLKYNDESPVSVMKLIQLLL